MNFILMRLTALFRNSAAANSAELLSRDYISDRVDRLSTYLNENPDDVIMTIRSIQEGSRMAREVHRATIGTNISDGDLIREAQCLGEELLGYRWGFKSGYDSVSEILKPLLKVLGYENADEFFYSTDLPPEISCLPSDVLS